MKKFKFYLLLIAVLSLVLVGCGNSEQNSEEDLNRANTDLLSLKTDQSVMLFSTLSSANALNQNLSGVTALSDIQPIFKDHQVEEAPIDMEKANSYLMMMENMLADGGPVIVSETASDREGYDVMMSISVKDLAGNISTYTIYYSIVVEGEDVLPEVPGEEVLPEVPGEEVVPEEEVTPEEQEIAYKHQGKDHGDFESDNDRDYPSDYPSDNKHHNHDKAEDQFKNHHHGDNEEEIEYDLNALAIIDGVEYEVIGKKEVEVDDNETEVEIEFIVKLDDANYVKVEQEIEDNEVEYKYVVYQNGKKQSSLTFETEEENGKTHIKLTTTENGYKETYKFIKEIDRTIIKYQGNGYSYTLVVTSKLDAETNELVYEYKVKEKEFNWEYRKDNKHGKH